MKSYFEHMYYVFEGSENVLLKINQTVNGIALFDETLLEIEKSELSFVGVGQLPSIVGTQSKLKLNKSNVDFEFGLIVFGVLEIDSDCLIKAKFVLNRGKIIIRGNSLLVVEKFINVGTVQVWDDGFLQNGVFVSVSESFYSHTLLFVSSRLFLFDNIRFKETLTLTGGATIDMVCFKNEHKKKGN